MNKHVRPIMRRMPRRESLRLLGGAGASLFAVPALLQAGFDCILTPEMTEGPYWVDEKLNRSDVRVDPSDGSVRPGVPLTLTINVHSVNGIGCAPLSGASVDIWHCDAAGLYSDVAANNTLGRMFLRGYQVSDVEGAVQFTTIYPGWYSGRTVHVHLRIRTYSGNQVLDQFTSQVYFDDAVTDQVFTQSPYNQRGARNTRNSSDNIYGGRTSTLLALTQTAEGYSGSIDIGVNLETPPIPTPALAPGGVGSAASGEPGATPRGWVSLYGQDLAEAARLVTDADLVEGYLPTTLGGVSVLINNKSAFMHYVSPTQVNVQAALDDAVGPVQVTLTNAGGTSNATANMLPILPAFFVIDGYIAAVRLDGVVVTGLNAAEKGTTSAARPGDILLLYGTGFGPTDPEVDPGFVFEGAYPLTNDVMITIGGLTADHSFAGLAAAGLYQFNVTVPNLPDGDHDVVATIAGLTTPAGVPLKVQNS